MRPTIVVKAISPEQRRSLIQKNLPPRVIVNPKVAVNLIPARVQGNRLLQIRWIVFLVFICCFGLNQQAFSQRQQIKPIAQSYANSVALETPPRPVLPPKTVVPRKKNFKTIVPER